jgi:hypothetical protein
MPISTTAPSFQPDLRLSSKFLDTITGFRGFLLWILFVVALALLVGSQQDYLAYHSMWDKVLGGVDPWSVTDDWTRNAYGPLFNAFALPYALWSMLPKVLFIGVWAWGCHGILRELPAGARRREGAAFLLVNVFFLVELIGYGHFDVLVAMAVIYGIRAYKRENDWLAALLFALGIALKFYPALAIPFLAVDRKGVRFRFVGWVTAFTVAIFVGAWAVWGAEIWEPFNFAAGREARQLSIFSFFCGADSILPALGIHVPLSLWKPTLFATGGFTFLLHLYRRLEPEVALIAAFLATFLIYPAGHAQFQTVLFFLVFNHIASGGELKPEWRTYLIFLSVYVIGFGVTEGYQRWGMSWVFNLIEIAALWLGVKAWRAAIATRYSVEQILESALDSNS